MSGTTNKNQRDFSLDIIRTLAIALVLILHLQADQLITGSIGQIGVPLFVILSGYLMLNRQYDKHYLDRFLKRNLLPFLLVTNYGTLFIFYSINV